MTRFPTLDAPSGQTTAELIAATNAIPTATFERIPATNPQVLKYAPDASTAPESERKAVAQIVVAFLALLWLATRKSAFK